MKGTPTKQTDDRPERDTAMTERKRPGRKPYPFAELDLPLPPAGNVSDLDHRLWADAAAGAIHTCPLGSAFPGVVSVRVIAGIPKEPRDLTEITRISSDCCWSAA